MMPNQETPQSGRVVGVCIAGKRGISKTNVGKGYLKANYGLVGDAHAGTERQVSLLMAERIEELSKENNLEIRPGDLAENITVEGIDLKKVKVGDTLKIGEAELEVVQIGKDDDAPHDFSFHGLSVLVTEGVYCKVLKDGWVKIGDQVLHQP
ncbi:MAG TPA: MOSC domain-containing protein [Peptococcaceae bacterium]|nr:MOSC domain-containing protein [Peptococcaceae bacterium]